MSNGTSTTCGCCEGVESLTPAPLENQPGLSALAYRVGTHGTFKESMLAALSGHEALAGLTTRSDDDPAVALIDAWSATLDVLGFYQERIANEGYLRTAAERRSVLELARGIGYELRPGVAASTFLAFTLENVPGAPEQVTIAVGTKGQSIPGQDELPQTFETVEEITAKGIWNSLTPRLSAPQSIGWGTRKIYLSGTATRLQAGDLVLVVGEERTGDITNENWDVRKAKSVEVDREKNRTVVTFDQGLGSAVPFVNPAAVDIRVYAFRNRAALFGYNAPDWNAMPEEVRNRYAAAYVNGLTQAEQDDYQERLRDEHAETYADLFADWPGLTMERVADPDVIDYLQLDAIYSKIVPGSWLLLSTSSYRELYKVEEVAEDSRSRFTLSSKTTRVLVQGENLAEQFNDALRRTVVYIESEELELAEKPIVDRVEGKEISLSETVEGLLPGRLLAVSGTDENGEEMSEIVELDRTEEGETTTLVFTTELARSYDRESVTINANVARATHGETKTEILGSGDGSKKFQSFTLKNTPLTYVSAATSGGAAGTLELRVNNVLWKEASSLYALSPSDRSYIVRLADEGTTTITFGDGRTGARLPTGSENVTAVYRAGIGMEGMVKEKQIALLLTRTLGLKGVTNPVAPAGAADPETLDDARDNAPLTVLTFDRIVSLRDFEDYARAFAGVGKAAAVELWDGERRLVHVTVAGADGGEVAEGSDLRDNLIESIDGARHADLPVVLDSFEPLSFDLAAKIVVEEDYIAEEVLAAVEERLLDLFSFARRAFAQVVTAGEVTAAMQSVEGVTAVDLDALYFTGSARTLNARLAAFPARWSAGAILPAQLLTVNAEGIFLTELKS